MPIDASLQLSIFLRLLLAALLSGVIGYDRESTGRPAGLRTHVLVCVSACLLVSLAEVVMMTSASYAAARVDPLRVLEAIIAGISFIGAGTIFRSRGDVVHGITTAGSLLSTAVLGAVIGFKLYWLAVATTALVYAVLRFMKSLEPREPRAARFARTHPGDGPGARFPPFTDVERP